LRKVFQDASCSFSDSAVLSGGPLKRLRGTRELIRFEVQGITLYAGDADSLGGGVELIDRGTLALTYGLNYGMVGRNGVSDTQSL